MYAHRKFNQNAQGQNVREGAGMAPYPQEHKYRKRGFQSLFSSEYQDIETQEYQKKHKGSEGLGVEEIAFKGANRRITLQDGMEHTTGADGKLRMLDAEYWGRSLKSYKKRIDYIKQIFEVVSMSSEVARQCLGDGYLAACAADATTYKGMAIPVALRCDCTPDLQRCYPARGERYANGFAKSIWLLERTPVALDGSLDEFLGDIKHSEETGRTLGKACE